MTFAMMVVSCSIHWTWVESANWLNVILTTALFCSPILSYLGCYGASYVGR